MYLNLVEVQNMTHQPTFYVHTNVSDWKFGGVITICQIVKLNSIHTRAATNTSFCYLDIWMP